MSRPPKTVEVTIEENKLGDFNNWFNELYDVSKLNVDELASYYENLRYHGFDRSKGLKNLFDKVKDKKILVQLILLCAIQGPVRAARTKLSNGMTPAEMGIPASGQQRTENISCARITSSTADLAAYYMKVLNVPKRMISHPCPAYLQFPAAGSIKMSDVLRDYHIDFAKKFSETIGGSFNDNIYGQMVANAYLDPRIKLFD